MSTRVVDRRGNCGEGPDKFRISRRSRVDPVVKGGEQTDRHG